MSFLTSSPQRVLSSSLSSLSRISPSAKSLSKTTAKSLSIPPISTKAFHTTSLRMTSDPVLNSENISKITKAETKITNSEEPRAGGPTAKAQSNVGKPINSQTLHDITEGEKKITGGERVKGGPTSIAQSILGQARDGTSNTTNANTSTNTAPASGKLDSDTISKITDAEKAITGSDQPVRGGPTAQAQKHANEPITSEALHDITEGEKKITGEPGAVKGGPTAAAQSELSKSRS